MTTLQLEKGAWTISDKPDPVEITLDAWREGVRPEAGAFALVLPNDADVAEIAEAVHRFDTVVLNFPAFNDGRAYSQAFLIRERYGFKGEIRARGNVLCDQALFMVRSGFTALEIGGGHVDGFVRALSEFTSFYQSAADDVAPVWQARTDRSAAA